MTRSLRVTALRLGDAGAQEVQPPGNSNLATGLGARVRGVVFDDLSGEIRWRTQLQTLGINGHQGDFIFQRVFLVF